MSAPPIHDQNATDQRARNLAGKGFNGMRMVIVDLLPPTSPTKARLEVIFFNTQHVNVIRTDASLNPSAVFEIRGGHRVPAGLATNQVHVTKVDPGSTSQSLILTVIPVGDYSTYTLNILHAEIDPLFDTIEFKFRPGCFTADCAPEWEPGLAQKPIPEIDYLAKDYDSFRHLLIAAMMQRIPGWQSTSEADLDQVLIDLIAAAGDELSDYQDRVMNEPYFASCRKRVSLARHARLMDYHIHQGNQARTWLALQVTNAFKLEPAFRFNASFDILPTLEVWTGAQTPLPASVFFSSQLSASFDPRLNNLRFYTWDDSIPALAAGSTSADLVPDIASPTQADAQAVVDLIRGVDPNKPPVRYLLIQEHLNPSTGLLPGRNPSKRQLLKLLPGTAGAAVFQDPVDGKWLVRVHWEDTDQLRADYCFTSFCPLVKVHNVSMFHGNLIQVHQGQIFVTSFLEPGTIAPVDTARHRYQSFERTERYGTLCALPDTPLAYLATPPGGEIPPESTLHVEVQQPGGGSNAWTEVISLVHSDDSAEAGNHFAVETDERRRTTLRFGNGVNGQSVPTDARIHCAYQVGGDTSGNIGFDSLLYFNKAQFADIQACWNPFDVTDGRNPEPVEKILRAVPEAYRVRQLRAVTLYDYIKRAEGVNGVSRAAARYAWTGSWRTVRLTIDPVDTTTLNDDLRQRVAEHIEAVRLIGEDVEIRPPRYVPLEIHVKLCLNPDFWAEDVQFVLAQEFSDSYTPDGRSGFFHPDRWTFGQAIHESEIAGRVHQVQGIEHILSIEMKRFNEPTPGTGNHTIVEVGADEIVQVHNDPDHLERGFIDFELKGGRQ